MVGESKRKFGMIGRVELHCEDLSGGYGRDATGAPTQRPEWRGGSESPQSKSMDAMVLSEK